LAEVLRDLDVEYVANVPGSSYRGLHDSIVNHLGNRRPELVLALHEETAVAIAHGYAKASERMMAAVLHANIGLLRAPMAVYNAWCDRAPVLLIGATGPWDAARRRATEWLHTSTDQGGLLRPFTKWDDQPGSPAAAEESLVRAAQLAQLAPRGPVYVNLDAGLQEEELGPGHTRRDVRRYAHPDRARPSAQALSSVIELLVGAQRPVILMGRCSRRVDDWAARVELAERLAAPVLTDVRLAAAFPTDHRLHPVPPIRGWVPDAAVQLLREADVILALDWPELAHTLTAAFGDGVVVPRVIHVSCDAHNHRGWSLDHRALAPSDVVLLCESDAGVEALLAVLPERAAVASSAVELTNPPSPVRPPANGAAEISMGEVGRTLTDALADLDVCFTRFPFAWDTSTVHFRHPLDSIGYDGGSGVGSGPGITVGAGLALRSSGRLPVAVLGDGDFIMGNTAIWTAAHYDIPCLFVVCNNRSFYTDERHQANIARFRGRPTDNKWIGSRIEDPDIDLAAMARALGAVALGPIGDATALRAALDEGVAAARSGGPCVIDVHVQRASGEWPVPQRQPRVRRWRRLSRKLRRS
jgi:thiamine pyrophosphate-dependent acetolactate synthase large subunit-like protein